MLLRSAQGCIPFKARSTPVKARSTPVKAGSRPLKALKKLNKTEIKLNTLNVNEWQGAHMGWVTVWPGDAQLKPDSAWLVGLI